MGRHTVTRKLSVSLCVFVRRFNNVSMRDYRKLLNLPVIHVLGSKLPISVMM
jgi:hypothetical protein